MSVLRCVAISDTHNQHGKVEVPDGDLLIHAGDATYTGKLEEIKPFLEWFNDQPHKHKIFVPGNHDFICQYEPKVVEEILEEMGISYLVDQCATFEGIHFYGSPWVPNLPNWAFSFEDCSEDLKEKFVDGIPSWTDVLITHGPPYGKLDKVPRRGWSPPGGAGYTRGDEYSVGSVTLRSALDKLPNLKYHIFGHIHEGHGVSDGYEQSVTFINAAICDRTYHPGNKPILFDIPLPSVETVSNESKLA